MAIVKRTHIGLVSGQVGEFIYRIRNGKLVQYRKPVKVNFSRSKAAMSARGYFAQLVRFAVFINSFPMLKQVWKNVKVPGSNHYQKIIKNNSAAIRFSGVSVRCIITPPGIPFRLTGLSFTVSDMSFRVLPDSKELKLLFSVPVILCIIICFSKPKLKSIPESKFCSAWMELKAEGNAKVILHHNEEVQTAVRNYNNAVVFVSALAANPGISKIYWTSTYAEEISGFAI